MLVVGYLACKKTLFIPKNFFLNNQMKKIEQNDWLGQVQLESVDDVLS